MTDIRYGSIDNQHILQENMGKNIKITGWTQKCYWKLKFIKCFYINDYFPGMTLSWYWGLTSILMNGLYILQTNNDDKYRHWYW